MVFNITFSYIVEISLIDGGSGFKVLVFNTTFDNISVIS